MSTMTRLPLVSSLPSGTTGDEIHLPFPSISTDSSSSIVSPLSLPLPRGTSGYFDISTASPTSHPASTLRPYSKIATAGNYNFKGGQSQVYSPLSPNARGPAVPQPPQFLSPHLSPITREVQYQLQQQQRSASLPPSYRGASPTAGRSQHSMAGSISPAASVDPGMMRAMPVSAPFTTISQMPNNNSLPSISSVSAGHPRSVSADAANAPSHVQMIRRLAQQNGRIREAWEAERKYMEANRERAEEVYKEERALMEEERAEWEDEKAGLLQEIERLQHLVVSLGGNPRRPSDPSGFANTSTAYASGSGQALRGGGLVESSPESMRSSHSSQGSGQQQGQQVQHERNRTVVWTGTVPQFQHSSGQTNPTQQQPISSNDATPPTDPTQGPETDAGPVPVVDIQEIHPELEGIPIKATSVQKSTFTDGPSQNTSKSSSRASSPSSSTTRPRASSKGSKEQTLEVLAAAESDRLTMHAGHTPSHSLSQLPTISTATTTASSSGDSTPTMSQADGTSSMGLATIEEGDSQLSHAPEDSNDQSHLSSESYDDPIPNFEATEDPELRGPLMVRNMPAHDEIFFRRLSDKLEEVQKNTQAALPAVLKDSPQADPHPAGQVKPETPPAANEESSPAQESGSAKESPKSGEGEELDIPLKIKRSFNFGAPFGEFR